VDGEGLTSLKSGNFINAFPGKVSGLQIKMNTNFGGSTKVVNRGNTSLVPNT